MPGSVEGGTGREIILALVVERPGSRHELEVRLQRRFPSHGYSSGIVRRTLGRLRVAGLVTERRVPRSGGRKGEVSVLEATSAGIERSRAWLREDPGVGSWTRDVLNAKIALCGIEDVPELLGLICAAEQACEAQLADLERLDSAALPVEGMGRIARDGELGLVRGRLEWLREIKSRLRRVVE